MNGKVVNQDFWGILPFKPAQKGTYNLVMASAKQSLPMPGDRFCFYTSPNNPNGLDVTTAAMAIQADIKKGKWHCQNDYCYVTNNPLNPKLAPFIEKNYP